MRDEKHRVYKLNLGKSSFTIEDLPAKDQAFNKMAGVQPKEKFEFIINYLKDNNIIYLNPSFNPTLPESRKNPKYLTRNFPNVKYLAEQVKKPVRNKSISNSKTLGNTSCFNYPVWYPENRFYVVNTSTNLIYKIV